MLRWLLPRRVLPWPQHPSPSPSPNQDRGDGVKTLVDVLRDDTQPQPMTDKRSTHRLQDPTSTWGPKWAGWELGESTHAEAGQHNALTSRLCTVHAMGQYALPKEHRVVLCHPMKP